MTLIELVVALGLLGLLLAAGGVATGVGTGAWLAGRETATTIRSEAAWRDRLQSAIAEMLRPDTLFGALRGREDPAGAFLGTANTMRFLTTHSPATHGRAGIRLVELHAAPSDGGAELRLTDVACPSAGKLQLLLKDPARTLAARPSGLAGGPAVITTAVSSWQFLYQGSGAAIGTGWLPEWPNGHVLPRAIRIKWTPRTSGASAGREDSVEVTGVVMGERGSRHDPSAGA